MFGTVLPSAATMPIASTKSGKAMMVSARRPTMRSVQPPKNPAATPASPPSTNTSATEKTAMPMSSRVATMTRERMSRPSWSVPNQWAALGACSAAHGVAGERVVGRQAGPTSAQQQQAANSAKAARVTGFSDT